MPVKITEKKWHSLSIEECFKLLKSSKNGLTAQQAENKRKIFGLNVLPEKKRLSNLDILFNQIKSPLVYVLLFAAVISLAIDHLTDAGVILFAVIINTIFGYWQENKANNAISRLKKIVKQQAKVLRDGREIIIDSAELVPGDVIFLRAGDKVPADARIFKVDDLKITEATLTGEAESSPKKTKILDKGAALADRENMIYLGTLVTRGQGQALVCEIGSKTELGKITQLIRETKEEQTPLQVKLAELSRSFITIIVVFCLVIFAVGFLLGKNLVEMFVTAIALAVAAIPEGLVVAVTIILTIGMQYILKCKALVRKLAAAETLGSASIICIDKTGTLTEGQMQVSKIITADKEYQISQGPEISRLEKVQDLISKISVLCSSAVIENPNAELEKIKIIGDPTEKALLTAAIESGFNKDQLDRDYIKLAEIPFNAARKFMATLHEHKDKSHQHIFVKGAPEKIFSFCDWALIGGKNKKLTAGQKQYLKNKYENFTKKGLRLLALGYKTSQKFKSLETELNQLVFLGFIALKDPLRKEAKEAFNLCYQAGIRPIIITGDHRLTAKAIFEELGLKVDGNIVEGRELDNWDDEELKKRVKDIDIYARVEPRHKLRVVAAWQARGEVVAMTGDGINDAPALKAADIGIALNDGSDVAKETADIILLNNNFKVIVAAIEQGRIIFDNIRKVILYLFSSSFSEIILIFSSLILGLPLPILATQILWINLVADGLPNIAMAFEPGEKGTMNDQPRSKNEPILNREMKILIFIISLTTNLILLGLFVFLIKTFDDLRYIRTIIFAVLGFGSLLYAFSVRSLRHSIFTQNPFNNQFLLGAIFLSFLMLFAAIYLPFFQHIFQTVSLDWGDWLIIFGLAGIQVLLIETVKYYFIVKSRWRYKSNAELKFKNA